VESDDQFILMLVSKAVLRDCEQVAYLGMFVSLNDFEAVTVPEDVLVGIFTEAEIDFVPSASCVMVLVLLNKVMLPEVVTFLLILVVVVYVDPAKVRVFLRLFLSLELYVHLTMTLQVTFDVLSATEYEFSVNEIDAVTAMSHHRP
jgi:hypothetical protein